MLTYPDGKPCCVGDVVLVDGWRGRETADVVRVDRDTITVQYRGKRAIPIRGVFHPHDPAKRVAFWRRER